MSVRGKAGVPTTELLLWPSRGAEAVQGMCLWETGSSVGQPGQESHHVFSFPACFAA